MKATLRGVWEAEAGLDVDQLACVGVDNAEIERFQYPMPKKVDV